VFLFLVAWAKNNLVRGNYKAFNLSTGEIGRLPEIAVIPSQGTIAAGFPGFRADPGRFSQFPRIPPHVRWKSSLPSESGLP
jgi:hypothetical protein